MELDVFQGQNKNELSMIEVARAILEKKNEPLAFVDIVNEIQSYLGKSDEEIRRRLPQFYTDLNTDGGFISLGDNVWGLREWYPYDSIDEEVNHPEDEGDAPKAHQKVNAFLSVDDDEDDDVIDDDYDDGDTVSEDDYDDYDETDDHTDALPDGIEGQLSLHDDDDDEDADNQ